MDWGLPTIKEIVSFVENSLSIIALLISLITLLVTFKKKLASPDAPLLKKSIFTICETSI